MAWVQAWEDLRGKGISAAVRIRTGKGRDRERRNNRMAAAAQRVAVESVLITGLQTTAGWL